MYDINDTDSGAQLGRYGVLWLKTCPLITNDLQWLWFPEMVNYAAGVEEVVEMLFFLRTLILVGIEH